jgi:hypothetical protein
MMKTILNDFVRDLEDSWENRPSSGAIICQEDDIFFQLDLTPDTPSSMNTIKVSFLAIWIRGTLNCNECGIDFKRGNK